MKIRILFFAAVFVGSAMFFLNQADTAKAAAPIGHFDGFVTDGFMDGIVSGWALRTDLTHSTSESHIIVHVYVDGPAGKGELVRAGVASVRRVDVNQVTGYAGDHGFQVDMPAKFKDGKSHSVYVYAIGGTGSSNALLPGSPKNFRTATSTTRHPTGSLVLYEGVVYYMNADVRNPFPSAAVFNSYGYNFSQVVQANNGDLMMPVGTAMPLKGNSIGKNPIGSFDRINNGYIEGWALDPDNASAAVRVEAYFDAPAGSPVTSIMGYADRMRQDVNNVTGYSGNHGFSLTIPDSMKDGNTHAVYVYAVDTSGTKVELPGSSITFNWPVAAALNVSFTSEATSINSGGMTVLHWQVYPTQATVGISDFGPVGSSGSQLITPQNTTTYTLSAFYNGQTVTKSVTVYVN
jgi:hypothetical protein